MKKHTPGPWEVERVDEEVITIQPVVFIHVLDDTDKGPEYRTQVAADARLIAAAPELLEAVFGLLLVIRGHLKPEGIRIAIDKAEKAMAKAEGNSDEPDATPGAGL